ncbi:MAG TPA: lipopolysaccharide biosynthesis protein [Edaphobacter sp.]|nr:lipopolysaccharide biosynthesis protein [Edaphobacter sp.]
MKDLKQRALRGGLARIISQASVLVLRTGSLMIMARLLVPKDFGLVGMVTAVIGVFAVFRDFGLSAAVIQRVTITKEQSSTLFWINLLVGAILSTLTVATGPFVAAFYHEPRLVGVTAALATAFLFNSAGVQHSAHLEREMRFVALSLMDILSLIVSIAIGITMALHGLGYWSLVATPTITPLVYTIGVWMISGWVPGRPHRRAGIFSMMRFGGTLTLNGLVAYFAANLDKVLLGRFCGMEALGIYGRAYQLTNIPTDSLNSAAGGVAFAALSRIQNEPSRFRSYFLKGYSLILTLIVPITLISAIFAPEIVRVFLGAKWVTAGPVFRRLAPITLAFAVLSPTGWMLAACGRVGRTLRIALVMAPLLFAGYAIGLHWGPQGVATGYSVVMLSAVLPLVAWAAYETPVSFKDFLLAISRPLISGAAAAIAAGLVDFFFGAHLAPLPRLIVGITMIGLIYASMLLYVMKQKQFYLAVVRSLISQPSPDESLPISA